MARFQPPASELAEQNAGQRFGLIALGLLMSWGLADIWRTPVLVADQGGSTFLILYAVLLAVMVMPVVAAEVSLGRSARQPPPQAVSLGFTGRSRAFYPVAMLMLLCALVLAVLYAVIGSRLLHYAWLSLSGQLDASTVNSAWVHLRLSEEQLWSQMNWLALIILPLWLLCARQKRDVMRVTGLLVPLLLLLLGVQLVNVYQHAGLEGGLLLLGETANRQVTLAMFKAAGEQALISLGAGLGLYTVVGAYSRRRFPVGRSLIIWTLGDLLWMVLSGLLVLSLAFYEGLPPATGGTLVFGQIPYFLSAVPLSGFYTSVFYIWLTLVVTGSLLALCEPLISWIAHAGLSRRVAALVVHATLWVGAVAYLRQESANPDTLAWIQRSLVYLILPVPVLLIAGMSGYVRNYEAFCAGLGWSVDRWKSRLLFRMLRYLSFPLIVIISALMILNWSAEPCWLRADQVAACSTVPVAEPVTEE